MAGVQSATGGIQVGVLGVSEGTILDPELGQINIGVMGISDPNFPGNLHSIGIYGYGNTGGFFTGSTGISAESKTEGNAGFFISETSALSNYPTLHAHNRGAGQVALFSSDISSGAPTVGIRSPINPTLKFEATTNSDYSLLFTSTGTNFPI